MKIFARLLTVSFLVMLCQCKPEAKRIPVKKTAKKNIKKKEVPKLQKSWDSLNSKNAEVFLAAYGKENKETKVLIETKFGAIKLRLYKDVPIHRANFIFLTKINYFNTTVIYRVAKNFVIQGGNSDNLYTQKQRRKYGNYLLKPEFRKNRTHKFGALAAARQWENNPDKLSSPFEFYIVHKRRGAHHLDNEHTVFGEVISGYDTMDKIAKVKVGIDEWPIADIPMTITVLD